jgi:hypothetical protein
MCRVFYSGIYTSFISCEGVYSAAYITSAIVALSPLLDGHLLRRHFKIVVVTVYHAVLCKRSMLLRAGNTSARN